MEFRNAMESFAEAWMAAAASANGNIFASANGIQSQPLSLTASSVNSSLHRSDSPNPAGKTVSIRCVIESINSVRYWNSSDYSNNNAGIHNVEVDRRVNIPVHTVFHNLLESVLHVFGYPKETIAISSGSIIIENWRPIPIVKLAQNPQKTVYDILGQISSFVTLRVQILRNSGCNGAVVSQIKEKLLQLLILQNREHILNSGCPLDQVTLKNILRGSDYEPPMPSDETLRKFDQWVATQYRRILRPIPYPSPLTQFPFHLRSPTPLHLDKSSLSSPEERVHPALQTVHSQYPTQKTRMRTSFDPELELPKLQKWFTENQHPSRQQIQLYVNELNNLESRRGRKPLDINNVVYWFKNARAAQKRAEVRNLTPGLLNSLNGYRSGSHSPCDTAITSKGSAGSAHSCEDGDLDDDDEDEDMVYEDDSVEERPPLPESPVAPLQLTTYSNNNNNNNNTTTNNNNSNSNKENYQHGENHPLNESIDSTTVKGIKQEPPDKGTHPTNDQKIDNTKTELNEQQDHLESEDEDMEDDISETDSSHKESIADRNGREPSVFRNSSPLSLLSRPPISASGFPLVPNSMFSQSFMYMSQYIPNLGLSRNPMHPCPQQPTSNHTSYSDDRRKRNRTFIDPVTEVPCLEKWFCLNTHPSHGLILQYTEDLNSMPYRQKFPRLEPKNVQFWFKNRRAKCKRLKTSLYDNMSNNLSPHEQYHQLAAALSADNYRNQDLS